ncbi:MAG: DUF4012 domain-containing protein [Acidimicrobiales bacterium]
MTDLGPARGEAPRQPAAAIDATPKFRPSKRAKLSRRYRNRRRGRTTLRLLILGALVAGAYAAVVALALVHARHELVLGRDALDVAKTMTSDTAIQTAQAAPLLRIGASRLESAHHDLAGALLRPLAHLPFIGRQLRSASALSQAGAQTASALADALAGVHDLTRAPPTPEARVSVLRQFRTIVTTARSRLNALDLGPSSGLVSVLTRTHDDLKTQLGRATDALTKSVAASNAAIDLVSGRHTALLLLTNNAEMRAGSGMVNMLGLLQFVDGRAAVTSTVHVNETPVPVGAVAASGDFGARWGWLQPTSDFQELLSSPRFDATGALAAQMWQAAGHAPVDAVIAVDPYALQAILGATGPISFGPRTIDASNVLPELLHDQYVQFSDAQAAARHEELGTLAKNSIAKLDGGGWSASKLGLNLATVVRGRHLMVWASSPADEQAWTTVGAAGTVGPDSVLVSLLNRSRDKADYFTDTNAQVVPRVTASGTDVTLTVGVNNRAPTTELGAIVGPGAGVQSVVRPGEVVAKGDYVGIVAVTLPAAATDVTMVGDPNPTVFGHDGQSMVVGEQFLIKRGTTLLITVRFHLPKGDRTVRLEPAARSPALYWRYAGDKYVAADHGSSLAW